MPATDQQVQTYADTRIRPRAEQFRSLVAACADDASVIGDVFDAVNQPSPTWTDSRTDGPPHLLVPSDVLTYNAVTALFAKFIAGTATIGDSQQFAANWPIFQKACVRPL